MTGVERTETSYIDRGLAGGFAAVGVSFPIWQAPHREELFAGIRRFDSHRCATTDVSTANSIMGHDNLIILHVTGAVSGCIGC